MTRGLEHLRVLDAAHGVAGPFAAQLLHWAGATVIKAAPDGDWLADLDTGPASLGRCLCDYVDDAKGVEGPGSEPYGRWLADRCAGVDVLVTDWSPATWRSLGLDPEHLMAVHPRLVIVSVTGFGLTGPGADRPSAELTTYHAGGEGYLLPGGDIFRAFPDRPPVRGGRFLADFDAGLAAALGAVAAVFSRTVSGTGDLVEVSAQEVELGNNRTTLGRAFHEGVDFDRGYAGYDYAGVLKCRDGWICLRPSEERHWQQFCAVIDRDDLAIDERFSTRMARFVNNDELNVVLGEWTADRSQAEVRAALLAAGCPGGPYLDADGVLVDRAIGSRGFIGAHPAGGRAPRNLMNLASRPGGSDAALLTRLYDRSGPGPLAGLRILDLTWVAAGPYATELLAFLGAEVYKVESRVVPDLFRRSLANPGADLDGNIRFADLNQGKKSIALNLKSDAGRALLLDLAEQCDVLIENYRPGVRDRLGIGDARLHERNPELVVVALSGFGATATDADRPGYASIFSAESGLSAMTGYADSPPADIRDTNDLRTGTAGAFGVLTGLLAVVAGERAVSVDASARDTLIALQGDSVLQASRGAMPSRSGNELDCCVPYDCYRSEDGWVAVAVRTDAEWSGLVEAVRSTPDGAALADVVFDDAALTLAVGRLDRRAEIDNALDGWCAKRSADAVAELLCAHGVPAARSLPASAIRADEHLRAREFLRLAEHPVLGELVLTGSPLRFRRSGSVEGRRPPLLGEHTGEVLTGLLGLSAALLADLEASAVLS